jgi:hypothetical protein
VVGFVHLVLDGMRIASTGLEDDDVVGFCGDEESEAPDRELA